MSVHDAVAEYRLRLVRVIEASPNRRLACRQAGVHPSTFYRWRKAYLRRGEAGLLPQRPVRVAPQRARWEAQVLAVALTHPNYGPQRLASELAWTLGISVSAATVWRILREHRLNTRLRRWQLIGGVNPDQTLTRPASPIRAPGRLDAEVPGDLVQMDCFHVGSFKESRLGANKARKGVIWQYTAIDVASSFLWAELHTTPHNPDPARTSALAYRVAQDLRSWGWTLKAISTDNGNEFRAQQFTDTVTRTGASHRFIRAGRPQSNGKVERVQRTLLEEFYQPVLINYTQPSITGLRKDLIDYLTYYNWQRPHHGRWNQGQTPTQIIHPDPKCHPPT